jgi:hypothetical protein
MSREKIKIPNKERINLDELLDKVKERRDNKKKKKEGEKDDRSK